MHRKIEQLLPAGNVIPVLTIERAEDAAPLARALVAGGLRVIEITLRTDDAIEAIRRAAAEVPDAVVGAGTVLDGNDLKRCKDAGAHFAVSPGVTPELLEAATGSGLPFLPGIATASELLQVREKGFTHAKFFPAEPAGGMAMLRALAGPFPEMRFCPTGGIGPANFRDWLELPGVVCVGGSWVAPADAVRSGDWRRITSLASEASGGTGEPELRQA